MASADRDTGGAPDEGQLREMTVDELRDLARDRGVDAPTTLKKDELVHAIARTGGDLGPELDDDGAAGAGPDGGRVRTGPGTSDSLQYSQEVTSPDDEPERDGRSLVTTSHEVIRRWAEARRATPATVAGTEHGDHLGVLRLVFGGGRGQGDLREVSWEEWFATFDQRRLNFIYQETRSDGLQSNFFRLESPDREDG